MSSANSDFFLPHLIHWSPIDLFYLIVLHNSPIPLVQYKIMEDKLGIFPFPYCVWCIYLCAFMCVYVCVREREKRIINQLCIFEINTT